MPTSRSGPRRHPAARRLHGAPWQDDDRGAFLVFEAVLVAVFIFTAVLFVTSLQRPTEDLERGDVNLGLIASDTLRVLQSRDPIDTDKYDNRLDEVVSEALQGNNTDGEALLSSILPPQTRYLLRLNNGVAPLDLLPNGTGLAVEPRGARAGEVHLMPNWTALAANITGSNETVYPGQQVTPETHPDTYSMTDGGGQPKCLKAPDGSENKPDGDYWIELWEEEVGRVPANIPYGVWEGYKNGPQCKNPFSTVWVVLPPGDVTTHRPVYGVQLVVWRAA